MRKIKKTKKLIWELTDQFEGDLDYIKKFDPVPFHIKREMAIAAANAAFECLERLGEKTWEPVI